MKTDDKKRDLPQACRCGLPLQEGPEGADCENECARKAREKCAKGTLEMMQPYVAEYLAELFGKGKAGKC